MAVETLYNSHSPAEIIKILNDSFSFLSTNKANTSALGTAASKDVAANTGTSADAGKIPVLGADGKLNNIVIGDLFSSEMFTVPTRADLVTLSLAKAGDFAAVTADEAENGATTVYLLTGTYITLTNWKIIRVPCAVISVAGKTGAVVLGTSDITGLDTALAGKLATSGDGKNVTITFTAAGTKANIATGDSLATICAKLAKWYASFGTLAWKSSIATSDFASGATAPLATKAAKVDKALTIIYNGTTYTYDGSAEKSIIIPGVPAVTDLTFDSTTGADAASGWALQSSGTYNGLYIRTLTSTKELYGQYPEKSVSSGVYIQVFAAIQQSGTDTKTYTIVSNAPFAGRIRVLG